MSHVPFLLRFESESLRDVIARCVNAAIFLSGGTRRDCEVRFTNRTGKKLFSNPQLMLAFPDSSNEESKGWNGVTINGNEGAISNLRFNPSQKQVRHLRPDERNISSVLKMLLYRG